MGRTKVGYDHRVLPSEVPMPLTMRSADPTSIRDQLLRWQRPNAASRVPDRTSIELLDTAPLPAISGTLALVTEPAAIPTRRHIATRQSILIVEDDPRAAGALRNALELEGESTWQIEVACDGGEALEFAARTQPDLVLLDIRLPDIDGAEVYRRLRATSRGHRARVLFLTAGTSVDLYQRGIEDGVLLRKPYDVQDLIGIVRAMLYA